jgi:hypothetical protein
MGGVTSTQSLLYAASSDITIERVRALVKQVGPESPTIEYKAQMADTIARGVAELANTYGGLLLVGVTDGRIVRGVKEKAIESVTEHCAAKLEPLWVPEIIPVPLGQGSDLYVLVLRVVPGRHPRPLLVDGIAYVRHQNTTHPADWQRLRDLFSEVSTARQDDIWDLLPPEPPRGSGDKWDLAVRSGLSFTIAPEAVWRPLAESTVTAFIDALNRSPLHSLLKGLILSGTSTGGINPFHRRGHNRSRVIRLAWTGMPDGWPYGKYPPLESAVRLEVRGGDGQQETHMRVEVDVVVRDSPALEIFRRDPPDDVKTPPPYRRVSPRQLGDLITGVLSTLASQDVAAPLAELGGIHSLAIPQPRVMHIRTAESVWDILDTTGLELIPQAGPSWGVHLLADPALDLADDKERDEQVRRWLIQLALDAGLTGMEDVLNRI